MGDKAAGIVAAIGGLFLLALFATFGIAVADVRGDPVAREIWVWVGRAWTGLCGVLPLAVAALLLGGAWIGLSYAAEWARSHSRLAYHRKGLLPGVVEVERPVGWWGRLFGQPPRVRVLAEHRNERAEVAQAVFDGNVDRANGSGVKALINPRPDEALLPEPESTLRLLPATASVYTATLPSEPSLLIGESTERAIALPLRNLGGGMIGGLQGYGKSELIAAMLAGLLRQDDSGRTVRLGLIDMKGGLDFARMPGDLAAWQWPIATDEGGAVALVSQLRIEIKRRQTLLVRAGVPNIETYNRGVTEPLPYLCLFIDEIMFLTAPSLTPGGSRLEKADSRAFVEDAKDCLAIGRAMGASLIMATQKPSADVVPTILRDLAGWKVAFRTTNNESSRAILAQGGAEFLPDEPGRALFVRGGEPVQLRTYLAGIETGEFDRFTRRLRRAERLRLVQDAESDGVGADDLPSDVADGSDGSGALRATATNAGGGFGGVAASAPMVAVGSSRQVARETARLGRMYRYWLDNGQSLRAVERHFNANTEGGGFHYTAAAAINEMLRRQGLEPQYKEKEA